MAEINKSGYSTHILGTVKSVMSCLGILLYDKSDISDGRYRKISLYNIDDVFKVVKESGKFFETTREKTVDDEGHIVPFIYNHNNPEITRFNVIIYLSPVDGSPIGYTEFRYSQGERSDTLIILDLSAVVEDLDVRLEDSLAPAEYSKRNYLGEKLNKYVSLDRVREDLKKLDKGEKYYTKFLTQSLATDESIYLDNGFVTKINELNNSLGFVKLNLEKSMNYNPHDYDFKNFNISYYGSDIVLCSWTDTNYCITSLTQTNAFNELIRYTKSNLGYYTLPGLANEITIDYTTGKYVVCNGGEKVFNVEKRAWETLDYPIAIVDTLDRTNHLYNLPVSLTSKTFHKYLPDLRNIYYNYEEDEYLRVKRKVGHWFVLNVTREGKNLNVVTGINFSLYLTTEQLKDLIFLDDTKLILKTDEAYLIYKGNQEEIYTEEAKKLLEGDDSYKTDVITVSTDDELYTTELNNYRRNYYPTTNGFPNIVTGFKGHLFYIDEENKINFI